MRNFLAAMFIGVSFLGADTALAQTASIQGTYKSVLVHTPQEEGGQAYHQFATITLKTVNVEGNLKISAVVRMIFGNWNSNEFLSYDYPEVPMNILTGQISITSENNDVSFVGTLRNGEIKGDWYNTGIGKVGTFASSKTVIPAVAEESQLVRTVTGHYKGLLTNTHPESNLPERMTMSLVTTQDSTEDGVSELVISGNLRFYLGEFGSMEYVETKLTDVQFNYYTRYLTVKTEEYGITLKGILDQSGNFDAEVFADGLGSVGTVDLKAIQ